MYTAFYELEIKPFQISSDPSFIWLGEKHKEALAVLRYGILDNKGFLLLTGDVGTGKTTLLNTLVTSLGDDVIYASVPDPRLIKIEFFNYIADAFGINGPFKTKGKFLKAFSQFLRAACQNNRKVLLLIDEAQLLTQDLLEEIRLLSNIEMPNRQMLNIFFVGQNEFNEVISRPENRAVAQRLTLNYYLEPLSRHETEQYIGHRLKIAGTEEKIFDSNAIREIHAYSGGFPRRINILCDHCLLTGYVKEKKTIDATIVTDCARELEIPKYKKPGHERTRPVRIQQPLPGQPDSQIPLQSYSQPQPLRYPDATSTEPRAKKSRMIMVALLLAILFLGLSSLMFPDFFAPYYQKTEEYLTALRGTLGSTRRELPSAMDSQGPTDRSSILKGTDINAGLAPPSAAQLPKQPASVHEQDRKPATTARAKGDNPLGKNPVSQDEQAKSLTPATSTQTAPLPADASPAPSDMPAANVSTSPEIRLPDRVSVEETQPNPFLKEKIVVRFVHDSNYFNPPDIENLKEFARKLIAHPNTMALISGYTDSTGPERYNEKLSEFRANIVRGFLLGQGVPPEQMRSEGRGTQNPIDNNDTTEGRTLNRRVEITVFPR